MMDDKRIGELRALCEGAAPGPWKPAEWFESEGEGWAAIGPIHGDEDSEDFNQNEPDGPAHELAQRDAIFIAAARTALPEALAEIERLRKQIADDAANRSSCHSCVRGDGSSVIDELEAEIERIYETCTLSMCSWCKVKVARDDDGTIRSHVLSCADSPAVQETERLRTLLRSALPFVRSDVGCLEDEAKGVARPMVDRGRQLIADIDAALEGRT